MFGERFRVDLVPIPLRGLKVIIGMDWLGANGAMIDCECQLVGVRTPSGGELVIHGERASQGPTLCSAVRTRRLLHHGSSGFLAYVSDMRVETSTDFGSVPVVQDFWHVSPEELPRVPPKELPGVPPIARHHTD